MKLVGYMMDLKLQRRINKYAREICAKNIKEINKMATKMKADEVKEFMEMNYSYLIEK